MPISVPSVLFGAPEKGGEVCHGAVPGGEKAACGAGFSGSDAGGAGVEGGEGACGDRGGAGG